MSVVERTRKAALWVLGVLIILGFFGGWITVAGSINELHGLAEVQQWPVRRGVITHSYARQVRGFQNRRYWDVEIDGTYLGASPGSKPGFSVDRIGYGFEFSVNSEARARRFAARFPVGTELDVYYRPDLPSYAILVRDNSPRTTWIAFGVGLFLGLLPLLLYIYGRLTGYKPPANLK